jgi:hypothetical protein
MSIVAVLVCVSRAWVLPVAVRTGVDPVETALDPTVDGPRPIETGDLVSIPAGYAAVLAPVSNVSIGSADAHVECVGPLFVYEGPETELNLTMREAMDVVVVRPTLDCVPAFGTCVPDCVISGDGIYVTDTVPVTCNASGGSVAHQVRDWTLGVLQLQYIAAWRSAAILRCAPRDGGLGTDVHVQVFRSWADEVSDKCTSVSSAPTANTHPVPGFALAAIVLSLVAFVLTTILGVYSLMPQCSARAEAYVRAGPL